MIFFSFGETKLIFSDEMKHTCFPSVLTSTAPPPPFSTSNPHEIHVHVHVFTGVYKFNRDKASLIFFLIFKTDLVRY